MHERPARAIYPARRVPIDLSCCTPFSPLMNLSVYYCACIETVNWAARKFFGFRGGRTDPSTSAA